MTDYFALAKAICHDSVIAERNKDKRTAIARAVRNIARQIGDIVMVTPNDGDLTAEERFQLYKLRRALQDLEEGVRPVRQTR